jgi:multicomponent Na+:H+ antiporter subunit E
MITNDKSVTGPADRGWEHPAFLWIVRVPVLFGLWLLLSGRFEVQFIVLGLLSSILVVALTRNLMRPVRTELFQPVPTRVGWLLASVVRFAWYLPYLGYQILRSNLEVAYLVLHPRLPISPRLVEFETPLKMEPAQVLLAQSITLTPGTITVDVRNGRFLVHSLYPRSAQGLTKGAMPRKVGEVFGTPASARSRTVVHDVDNVRWFYEE